MSSNAKKAHTTNDLGSLRSFLESESVRQEAEGNVPQQASNNRGPAANQDTLKKAIGMVDDMQKKEKTAKWKSAMVKNRRIGFIVVGAVVGVALGLYYVSNKKSAQ